jgi:hypothetical protein
MTDLCFAKPQKRCCLQTAIGAKDKIPLKTIDCHVSVWRQARAGMREMATVDLLRTNREGDLEGDPPEYVQSVLKQGQQTGWFCRAQDFGA